MNPPSKRSPRLSPTKGPRRSRPAKRLTKGPPPAQGSPEPVTADGPPPKRKTPRLSKGRAAAGRMASGFAVALLVVGIPAALLLVYGNSAGAGKGRAFDLAFSPGTTVSDAAETLTQAGLVEYPRFLIAYAWLTGRAGGIPPGPHLLTDDLGPAKLLDALHRRPGRPRMRATLPEGWNSFDMARRLAEKGIAGREPFLAATRDRTLLTSLGVPDGSAEGYLFPSTYDLPINSDPKDVVRRLVTELQRRMETLKLEGFEAPGAAARALGWSLPDVIALASVVEKEATADEERALVASVFFNRFTDPSFLPKPARLQSDPTAAYGCLVATPRPAACITFNGKITPDINHDPTNPYSTYVHAGLPPGPIANPGEKSIRAVLSPASTNYLYFVSKGGGRHTFSATLAEHNEAVRRLREGKP